jgi:hypothetical protein
MPVPAAPSPAGRFLDLHLPENLLHRLLRFGQIVGMQEPCFLVTNVYESGLDPGKDRVDLSQVDVADHVTRGPPLDHELDELAVLADRYPDLLRG